MFPDSSDQKMYMASYDRCVMYLSEILSKLQMRKFTHFVT